MRQGAAAAGCFFSARSCIHSPPPRRCPPQIAAAQEDIERLAASRSAAQSEAAEAEAAAQQALEAGHGEVMKLRRRWDELAAAVERLGGEREAVLEQIEGDKAEWARLQQVRGARGMGGAFAATAMARLGVTAAGYRQRRAVR